MMWLNSRSNFNIVFVYCVWVIDMVSLLSTITFRTISLAWRFVLSLYLAFLSQTLAVFLFIYNYFTVVLGRVYFFFRGMFFATAFFAIDRFYMLSRFCV